MDWAATAFRLFGGRVALWATFNEPTCAAFTGHIAGVHAPGRRGRIADAGRVLLHMLRAHGAAYRAIKVCGAVCGDKGGEQACTGWQQGWGGG